ncbi:MAG: 3-hydroxyacyl-CoA dehydrogenase [Deltaproteobacteria bacterium]|nr:3-hydroxyacyl-CoA dehydrogenase [Deltaproteobacteria bacterium]
MKIEEIRRVLILGAGTMGQQIGFVCAMHGYDVVFYDIAQDLLDVSMKRIEKLGSRFAAWGRITEDQLSETLGRISVNTDPAEAAGDADFVSESIPENPELKGKVFAQFNKLCPERTIFTTNTSTLLPSMFAEATGRPDKLAALHFHDVRTSNVVDVMPHPGTSRETTELVEAFARSIGQIAIVLHKENNGYVFNSMLSAWFYSALSLASNEVATIEDIDRAWMGVMHTPIGPFGIMDQIGLKTVWTVNDYWAQKVEDPQARKNADYVKSYVDQGLLGAKTRKGFYTYPNPAFVREGFLAGEAKEE